MSHLPHPIADGSRWQPRFYSIWLGQSLSLTGSALTQFVLMWWITQKTGSAAALALAGVMGLLPTALFSPLGGALADRWSRRWLMIVSDAITALCMLLLIALFALDVVELWHVYALMFVRATMHSFQRPAASASTVNLVPRGWVERVAGMNQAMEGVMGIAAAPLGALALAFVPTQGALLIDIVTALLGIAPLLFFRIPQPRAEPHAARASLLANIQEGARYVAGRRGLLLMYAVTGLVVLTIMPTFAMTPLLVLQHFGGGVNEVALMEGLAGVGIVAGGALIAVWAPFRRRIFTVAISWSASCLAVALTALAPADALWLGVFWWFVSGVTYSTGNAPMMAILQLSVPNELQGRALSLFNMVIGVAGPIGLALAGPLGEQLGVRNLFVLGGTLSAALCLLGFVSRDLRNVESHESTARVLAA